MSQKELIVYFQKYTSELLTIELRNECGAFNKSIKVINSPEHVNNHVSDVGKWAESIILYIKTHPTELVAGGILVNAIYDVFKAAVKVAWKKIYKTIKDKKIDPKDYDAPHLTIVLTNDDKDIIWYTN